MQPFQKGDIIIFKAEDNWLSKAIAKLTDSDVCHASMAYSEHSIVEVGSKGIVISNIDFTNGDDAYILRLKGAPDCAPLLRSADNYLNAKTRYDFPGLFLLAGLLIYKDFSLTSKLLPVFDRIFAAAVWKLDEFLQQASRHSDEPAVVCSQLIYQIFYDCGGEYRIKIENGVFFQSNKNLSFNEASINAGKEVRLIDLLEEAPVVKNDAVFLSAPASSDTEEALAKELYEALTAAPEPVKNGLLSQDTLSHTLSLADSFLSKLKALLSATKSPLTPEGMFVTPADMVYHSTNLTHEGMLSLKRIKS